MNAKKQLSRTPGAESFTRLILETFRFNGRLLAAGDRLVKDLGLTSALWQVLGAIDDAPLPMAQIARNMGLARQSVRRSVHLLQERGFICFQDNPNHQRAKLVMLTPKGRDVLDQVTMRQIEWANTVSGGLNEETLERGVQLMKTIGGRL